MFCVKNKPCFKVITAEAVVYCSFSVNIVSFGIAIFTSAFKTLESDSKLRLSSPSNALKYLTLFSKLVVPIVDFSKISQPTCLFEDASLVTNFIFAIFTNCWVVLKVKSLPEPVTIKSIPAPSSSSVALS